MSRPGGIAVAVCVVLLAGCAGRDVRDVAPPAQIAAGITYTLPAASGLQSQLDASQRLRVAYDQIGQQLRAEVELRPGRIMLVALNDFGLVLFSASYDGSRLEASRAPGVPAQLQPELVLADFLLTYQPADEVAMALSGATLEVSVDGRQRTVRRDDDSVIVIDYTSNDPWEGAIRFTHVERGYVLEIETLEITR